MTKGYHKLDGVEWPVGSQTLQERKSMVRKVTRARKQTDKKLAGYTAALKAGNKTEARKIADQYMKSYSGRLVAVVDQNRRRRRDQRYTLTKCHKIAAGIKAHKPCDEKVWVSLKPKKSGGKRVIQNFGLRRRSAQRMVRTILQLRVSPQKWQFTLKGVQNAIRIVKEFDPSPDTWVARLDITDFYGSFTCGGLNVSLWDIPKSIVKNTLLGEGSNIHYYHMYDFPMESYTKAARQGVPQGSVVSPLIGALAVSQIAWEPDDGVVLINYVDDFLILAPSKEKLEKAIFALDSAVTQELPGGNFHLKHEHLGTFSEGVDFLGHSFSFETEKSVVDKKYVFEEMFVIMPTPSVFKRLGDNVDTMSDKIKVAKKLFVKKGSEKHRDTFVSRLAELYAHLRGWKESFSECDPVLIDAVVKDVHLEIGELLHGTDVTSDQVVAASSFKKGWMHYSETSDQIELDLKHEDYGDDDDLV